MIYLFAGDDAKTKRAAYDKFIEHKQKEQEVFFVSKNSFDRTQVESFYSGAGLFFATCVVSFENVFDREEAKDFIFDNFEKIAASQNDFIFLEGKLLKPELDAFKKARAELNIFELSKAKKEKYDNFILANDLERRDKLNLWIHFREAMDKGVAMEELTGILFWKAKDMILKNNFGTLSEAELQNFALKISYILPEARKEGKDTEAVFEQFLLEVF